MYVPLTSKTGILSNEIPKYVLFVRKQDIWDEFTVLSQEQGLSFQEFIMSWALDDRRLSNVLKISLMWDMVHMYSTKL